MIYQLSGLVSELGEEFVVLEVQGVGYQVFVSQLLRETLGIETPIKLYTYHHIREDAQTLFGFLTVEERAMFISLISVSGVGPKAGLKILSQFTLDTLIQALLTEDVASFTHVPGIGKKTAERLIIELKDKVSKLALPVGLKHQGAPKSSIQEDVTIALRGLGYSLDEIKRAISKTDQFHTITSLEEGIKRLLRNL